MFCAALLAVSSAVGAEGVNAVAFWKTDGQKVTVLFDEQPKVTFTADEMRVTTHMSELSFPAGEVVRLTHEWVTPDRIAAPAAGDVRFHLSEDGLRMTALPARSVVEVYASDGKRSLTVSTDGSGNAVLDMRSLPSGVYVIRTSAGNFKIRKP